MNPAERIADWTTRKRVATIVVLLLLTAAIGAGSVGLEQETDLGQFETESIEAEKLEYINEHFGDPEEDQTTAVQIIIQGENVLDRETLLATLQLQQDFQDDPLINDTLVNDSITDLASVIATALIQNQRGDELAQEQAELAAEFDELNQTILTLAGALEEIQSYQGELTYLEFEYASGQIGEEEYESERAELLAGLNATRDSATEELTDEQTVVYLDIVDQVRSLQIELTEIEIAYETGEIDEEERETQREPLLIAVEDQYDRIQQEVLGPAYADLVDRADELEAEATAIAELDPSLSEQQHAIEEAEQERLDAVIEGILGDDAARDLLTLLPTDYDPGSIESDARITVAIQSMEEELSVEGDAPPTIVDSQLRMAELVDDRFGDDGFVFGQGIITDELNRSLEDSLILVIPFALLLVIGTLLIAYRDVLDIILGVVGIITVLIWTFGFMGWANIDFNQIFIAVPVLLIGLSIDYAIHVFMRQREQRQDDENRSSGVAMRAALAGLLVALTWVTATAVFGFLANLVSPVEPIRNFGIVSAFGIIAALVIFGLLVPAVKVSLDNILEGYGIDRRKRAFGTSGGRFTGALSIGQRLAKRAPIAVIIVALLLTAGGAYAASDIDTSFEVEDFIASEPAEWTQQLPSSLRPGEYSAKANLEVLDDRFLRQDMQANLLIEGAVSSDNALQRIEEGTSFAGEKPVTLILADGSPAVTSPLTEMEDLAAQNEEFRDIFDSADTTDDGIPDTDITGVYDAFFEHAPDRAMDVIHRTDDGEYHALLMTISLRGDADTGDIKSQLREVAASMDGDGFEVTATGQTILFTIIEEELFETVFESLLISLVAVFLFLMIVYRITDGSASLGIVTLAPIALAVAWILGTMYLIGMPFNVVTGTITSLTIGLGVAYNIHMSERFRLELSRGHDVMEALHISVTGTGGALLGSAATTAGGFGVLVLAIIPILQQFGIITALTIIYAFLGSVLILPSLLVLWLKYLGNGSYPEALDDGSSSPESDA